MLAPNRLGVSGVEYPSQYKASPGGVENEAWRADLASHQRQTEPFRQQLQNGPRFVLGATLDLFPPQLSMSGKRKQPMRRGRTLSNFSVVPNQKNNVIVTIGKRLCSGDDASALRYPVNDVMHDRGQLRALRRREGLCRLQAIQWPLTGIFHGDTDRQLLAYSVEKLFFRGADKIAGPQGLRSTSDAGGDAISHCAPPRSF